MRLRPHACDKRQQTSKLGYFRPFQPNPSLLFPAQRLRPESGDILPCFLNESRLLSDGIAGNYGANARLSLPVRVTLSH